MPIIEGIHAATAATQATDAASTSDDREEHGGHHNDDNSDYTGSITISVDTRRAAVAEAAVAAGAHAVNDVSGGMFDPGMLPAVARAGVPLMMMHMR